MRVDCVCVCLCWMISIQMLAVLLAAAGSLLCVTMAAHDSLRFPSRFFFSFSVAHCLSELLLFSVPPLTTACPSLPSSMSLLPTPTTTVPPSQPSSLFSPSLLAAVPKWAGRARQTHHRAEQRAIQRLADSSRVRWCFEPECGAS